MSRYRALAKALSGWAILTLGVTLSIAIAQAVGSRTETGPAFIRVSQAVLVTLFVVPAIVACRRLLDRRTLAGMGLSRHWPAAAATGVAVAVVTGAVVWTPVFLIGWARFDHLEPAALATFLAVNAVVLLLYEALPEEIALRGYGWSTLRESWGPLAATMTITVLFCLSTALSNLIRMASTLFLGGGTTGFSLAPSGNDPFFYIVLLFVFGLTLVAARRIPLPGALTSAIAFHHTFLTINRVLLGGLGWIDSGVGIELATPEVAGISLVHVALAGTVFMVVRRWLERRTAVVSRRVA